MSQGWHMARTKRAATRQRHERWKWSRMTRRVEGQGPRGHEPGCGPFLSLPIHAARFDAPPPRAEPKPTYQDCLLPSLGDPIVGKVS